jgi:F420-dependent hydroxymycolic acid dehydrogenase
VAPLIGSSPNRRGVLRSAAALVATPGMSFSIPAVHAASEAHADVKVLSGQKLVGFMLAHEQFTVPHLTDLGAAAARAGFGLLATSDHFQPWQANQGHCGGAWVTLGALGGRTEPVWIGTTVTCPILRYHPAAVAEAFATLAQLYPGRVFLGVGSGEALNEQTATGDWPAWPERWERLIEAIDIIRALWSGQSVSHRGKYYAVEGRLYDPPLQSIPILAAANGKKSMRLAGLHADGLVTDPLTWQRFKSEWEAGAKEAGKNTADMPVLVEQFVVVGDKNDAAKAAALWRFLPKAFKTYYKMPDPAAVERRAGEEQPLDQVFADWPIGTDPAIHIAALQKLFDSGATIVNVHSGQADQNKVIDFYRRLVLPEFAQAASDVVR